MSYQRPYRQNYPPQIQPPEPKLPFYLQTRFIIALFSFGLVAICGTMAVIKEAQLSSTSSIANNVPTATTAPTATNVPLTSTPAGPHAIANQAILGGLASYFYQTYPLKSATFAGVSATLDGSADPGIDGQPHMDSITFTVPTAPDDSQMEAFLKNFFPSDAHATGTQTISGNIEHIYSSQDLTKTFSADTFAPMAAGTFSWYFALPTQCNLSLGG